jgi:hypothetical protein
MKILSVAVDSGYLTDDVLNYTRLRQNLGVFAIKGASQRGRQILGRPSKVDVNWKGAVVKAGAELWLVGTDSAKHRLFARLAGDRKHAHASGRIVHFSHELPDDFYMQLSAEIFDPNKRAWVKLHGRRNEALDTHVYAMVAALHPRVRVHVQREHDWAALERVLEPKEGDLFARPADVPPAEPEAGGGLAGAARPDVCTGAEAGARGRQIELGDRIQGEINADFRNSPQRAARGAARPHLEVAPRGPDRRLPGLGWTLKYYFKQFAASGAHIELTATADGDYFAITVAAATTAAYTAGRYSWAAEVSGGSSEVYEVDRGTIVLLPRYDQAAAYDDRSHARKMLDAIEAVLESRASADQLEYTIGSRHLKKMSPKELTDWRDYYRSASSPPKKSPSACATAWRQPPRISFRL